VVTVDGELLRQARKHAFLRGGDDTGFAVHQFLSPNDLAAKGRTNALVPQAHAQNGQLAHEVLNRRHRNARFRGEQGPGEITKRSGWRGQCLPV
jgi:hypothetical protein